MSQTQSAVAASLCRRDPKRVSRFTSAAAALATLMLVNGPEARAQPELVHPGNQVRVIIGRVRNFKTMAEQEASTPASAQPIVAPPFNLVSDSFSIPADVPAIFSGLATVSKKNAAPANLLPPAPKLGFLALEDNDRAIPPDTQGAVGPNHLLTALNSQVRIQSRSGETLSTVTLYRFWTNLVDGVASTFDPRTLYDSQAERWILVTGANLQTTNSLLLVAVSETSDPTGNWFGLGLPGDVSKVHWADFPIVGLNTKWLVVTAALYTVGTNKFGLSRVNVLNKNQVYAGASAAITATTFDDKAAPVLAPSVDNDHNQSTMYFVNAVNGNSSGKGFLRLSTLEGDLGSEAYHAEIASPAVTNTWAAFPNPQDFAPQLGSEKKIHSGDHRILNSVTLRNGSLWLAHTVFLPAEAPARSAIQWWELALDGSVRQFGRMDDPAGKNFYAYPSLAVNKNNDLLLGYSRFSDTQYVSANYSFRAATDPKETLRPDTVLKIGESPYVKTVSGTRNRWGDYSSTLVDPINDLDMWTLLQYAGTRTNSWSTWWGQFILEPTGVPPSISSFSPATGGAGASVTIIGAKLTQTTTVTFNGVNATSFTVNSSSRVTAVVPLGASTGPLRVVTPDGAAMTSSNFVVLPTPAIGGFVPDRGGPNSAVVIAGVNLTGATSVKFNDAVAAQFKVDSATQITATVPASATTGRITITTPSGVALSATNFIVTLEPFIASVTPVSGGIGMAITLTGANLGAVTEVRFNGLKSPQVNVLSATQITATVPAGATTGFIEVITPNGTARIGESIASAPGFTVVPAPVITDFDPKSQFIGGTVTLIGANLTDATLVRFNGIGDSTFTVDSPRQITAHVPLGAATGFITVTTAGGTATNDLTFVVIPPPLNDPFVNAQTIVGSSGSATGSNVGATKETGEPDHLPEDAQSRGGRTIWYRWTAPVSGVWNFHTTGSKIDTTLAVYTGTDVAKLTPIAANDDADAGTSASSVSFAATVGTVYSVVVSGFRDTAGDIVLSWASTTAKPIIDNLTPTSGPVGSVVTLVGANFSGTTEIKFNTVIAPDFTVNSPNRITVRVPVGAATGPLSVTTSTGVTSSATPFTVTLSVSNDHFANGLPLTGTSGTISGDNTGASFEPGEPKHANVDAVKSVWYRWTAPTSGRWTFDTRGTAFDTVLAVYTGDALTTLTEIASNDDSQGSTTSSVAFDAVAGTLYHVVVDGFATGFGKVVLNWTFSGDTPKIQSFTPVRGDTGASVTILGENFTTNGVVEFNGLKSSTASVQTAGRIVAKVPANATTGPIRVTTARGVALSAAYFVVSNSDAPDNDLFSDAQALSGRAWVTAGRTTSASKEPDEPDHAGEAGGKSVWYRWSAPENGTWILSTAGSGFDTLLSVYTGNSLTNLTFVAGNDDADGAATSKVQFQGKAGTTYLIAADGYGGESGSLILRLVPAAEPKVIYASGFEASEGYQLQQPLAGQQAWNKSGTGGQLVVTHPLFGAGQQAQIGGTSAGPSVRTAVWRSITNSLPIVQFSVSLLISPSTNGEDDFFDWAVFNPDGQHLFSIDFDNFGSLVSYELDDGQGTRITGVSFENDRVYQLSISMDFRNNSWSAFLDQQPLVTDARITTFGAALKLGDIDAAWLTDATPGDNAMVFDNYRIVAETNAPPAIFAQPQSQTVTQGSQAVFGVAARGTELMSYQWRFNDKPVTGATNAVLILNNVLATQAGSYSVEVKNELGNTLSAAATLTVNAGNVAPLKLNAGPLLPDGRFPLTLTSAPGARFSIEASTDLSQWTEVASGVNTSGTFNFFDTPARAVPQRFFRARQL